MHVLRYELFSSFFVIYWCVVDYLSGCDLVKMAKNCTIVIQFIEDVIHPAKCRMFVGMVASIFSYVAYPDQKITSFYSPLLSILLLLIITFMICLFL